METTQIASHRRPDGGYGRHNAAVGPTSAHGRVNGGYQRQNATGGPPSARRRHHRQSAAVGPMEAHRWHGRLRPNFDKYDHCLSIRPIFN